MRWSGVGDRVIAEILVDFGARSKSRIFNFGPGTCACTEDIVHPRISPSSQATARYEAIPRMPAARKAPLAGAPNYNP